VSKTPLWYRRRVGGESPADRKLSAEPEASTKIVGEVQKAATRADQAAAGAQINADDASLIKDLRQK